MEYLFKALPKTEIEGRRILLNEYLGVSCDSFLEDFLKEFSSHTICSFYKLSFEYSSRSRYSLLEDPSAFVAACRDISSSEGKSLLVLDGWNLRQEEYSLPFCTVLLIERSVTSPSYKEMYGSYVVISVRPLQSAALLYTNLLKIEVRDKQIEIDLLYRDKAPLKYIPKDKIN